MAPAPKVVAFDIIETTFSLEPIRGRLVEIGLPPSALELWFAMGLRDAFALGASNDFQPFASVLGGALDAVLAMHDLGATEAQKQTVIATMRELPPQPDAQAAFEILAGAGIRIVALSNGAPSSTRALLDGAGLDRFVERIFSVEDVKLSKPRPEVYLHAVEAMGLAPAELALVATHAWDVHGAKAAGLTTGFVARGQPFPPAMRRPDVVGESLSDVARLLAGPPR